MFLLPIFYVDTSLAVSQGPALPPGLTSVRLMSLVCLSNGGVEEGPGDGPRLLTEAPFSSLLARAALPHLMEAPRP